MAKNLSKPELKQFGMDGWEKHFEHIVTCTECNTAFLSNAGGEVICNGETYQDCPYCAK